MTHRQYSYLIKRFEEKEKREDHRAGEIIAMIYNANRNQEEDPQGVEWWDFFPVWKPEREKQTEDEMFAMMLQFTKQREGLSR